MSITFSRSLWYRDGSDQNRVKAWVGLTNVKLQPASESYPTGAYTLTETAPNQSGIYSNDAVSGGRFFKIYVNDAYQSQYGIFWLGDDPLPDYLKKNSGAWDMGGIRVYNILDPTTGLDAFDLDFADARFTRKAGSEIITNQWTFENYIPKVKKNPANGLPMPTDDGHVSLKIYNDLFIKRDGTLSPTADISWNSKRLKDLLNPVLNTDAVNLQTLISRINSALGSGMCPNLVRLIVDPLAPIINDIDAVTWGQAISNAVGLLTLDPDMFVTVHIQGAGLNDIYIDVSPGEYQVDPFEDRVCIKSISKHIHLRLHSATQYAVTIDKVYIEDCTIIHDVSGAGSSMDGFIFDNCFFKLTTGASAFTIKNAKFRGINMFKNDRPLILDNCKGVKVYVKSEGNLTVQGTNKINYEVEPSID